MALTCVHLVPQQFGMLQYICSVSQLQTQSKAHPLRYFTHEILPAPQHLIIIFLCPCSAACNTWNIIRISATSCEQGSNSVLSHEEMTASPEVQYPALPSTWIPETWWAIIPKSSSLFLSFRKKLFLVSWYLCIWINFSARLNNSPFSRDVSD